MAEVKTANDSSDKTFDCLNAKSSKKTSKDELAPGFTIPTEQIAGVPDFGWRVPLSYSCQMKCKAFFTPRLKQIPSYLGLGVRYCKLWMRKHKEGKRPFIDHMNALAYQPIYGAPIGGIGCGTIGRGYQGEFCRFQLVPGCYDHTTVLADQFIVCIRKRNKTVYQQVLSVKKPDNKCLNCWKWNLDPDHAIYHALYPHSWTIYDIPEHNVRLTCRQVSPIFPHEYQDTSLPCAVFVWTAENLGDEDLEVSIMFTFKNGRGVKEDRAGGCWNEYFHVSNDSPSEPVSGVQIHQSFQDMPCVYGIAVKHKPDLSVSHCVYFDPCASGEDIWQDLHEDGSLTKSEADLESKTEPTKKNSECAVGVCCKCAVAAGGPSKQMEFSLSWDMPNIHFKSKGQNYRRRYTRWFGHTTQAAPQLCSYALNNYKTWEQKIETWQNTVLQNNDLPAWYKSALFNELYYVSDGGTVWLDPVPNPDLSSETKEEIPAVIKEFGKFAYLEGHEYRMYNTYDVHFYASFALLTLWPKLQLCLQYDFAKAIDQEDPTIVEYLMCGTKGPNKSPKSIPHDLGDPEDEPWVRVNTYNLHPTHDWKDLNLKFILQVFRDYYALKDLQYLKDMYPKVKSIMTEAQKWDKDGDGLIENGGFADQTFDAWTATGASAYCGGIWLAALRLTVEMAKILEDRDTEIKFTEILHEGKESFDKKLWNGLYYNYDCSDKPYHDSIMAAQLIGQWFIRASGIQDDLVFPSQKVRSVLKVIYEHNVMKLNNGNCGAVNGGRLDCMKDTTNCQAEEFWVGIIYSLAATMIQEGMSKEGFQTAWGAYHMCWEVLGLSFQTPEAYTLDNVYRSLGYMRPLAIWSIQWALSITQSTSPISNPL
ncbi:non-lysosomal glucosylceramidase-like [Octopus vulgaris]|uniref:Non-lysosomal glucosylceramidase n=1 Tax=Octopus vulgaris TaxID=6645 RepID=A0AA36BC63_OCTVU|nr:non-lysosomal glucosylceramidase-like [Octopus vulgaris]